MTASRRASRPKTGEANAFRRHLIEVRCLESFRAVDADVGKALRSLFASHACRRRLRASLVSTEEVCSSVLRMFLFRRDVRQIGLELGLGTRETAKTWRSRRLRPGRPCVARDIRELIRNICRANPLLGAPRVHGELVPWNKKR